MVGRIRDFFNSLLNAPAKPHSGSPSGGTKLPGRAGSHLDRWLSGPPSSDPLYLTNRTFFQKARVWLLVGIPCVAIATFSALSSSGYLQRQQVQSPEPLAVDSAPAGPEALPDLDKVKVNTGRDVDLMEVEVTRGAGTMLKGRIRNNTGRQFHSIDLVFDLTDLSGSHLGAVSVHLANLRAKAMTEFHQPLQQKAAVNALIRDVHTE